MKKNNFISILFNLLILFLVFILYEYDLLNLELSIFCGLAVNIYILFNFYNNYKTFKSGYFLFLLLSIPFLYGQIFTRYILGYVPKGSFDLSVLVSKTGMIKAIVLIIICQLFTNIGYNLCREKKMKKTKKDDNYNYCKEIYLLIGWILFLISVVPAISSYYSDLKLVLMNGYSGKLTNVSYGMSSFFSKMVPFFFISVLMLLLGYKNNKRLSTIIFILAVAFYGSQVIFGNRGIPLLYVICIIFYYHFYIRKVKTKNILLLFIMCILLIPFLNTIKIYRKEGLSKWIFNTGDMIKENYISNNTILDLSYEMGTTIYPITYTIEHIPSNIGYKYGQNYLYSLISVVKFNTSSTRDNDFNLKMNIAEEIGKKAGSTFGGSYIQEAYANFGLFCAFFMILFGYILKKLDLKLWYSSSYITIVLIIYILNSLLWIIRNTMISIPRTIFWYALPVYFLFRILKLKKDSNKEVYSE